jgi:hypothetical protein
VYHLRKKEKGGAFGSMRYTMNGKCALQKTIATNKRMTYLHQQCDEQTEFFAWHDVKKLINPPL